MSEVDPNSLHSTFRTKFNRLNEWWFGTAFAEKYPDYPTFDVQQTEASRASNARAAMEMIAGVGLGQRGTDQGRAVLKALGLQDQGNNTYGKSPWLAAVKKRLSALGQAQFLNASELFEERDGRIWFKGEHLEAEYLLVVLMAGVAEGDLIVVGKQNAQYDASKLEELYNAMRTYDDVVRIGRPKERPLDEWRALFEVLKLNKGELAHESRLDAAIGHFVQACSERINLALRLQEELKMPLPFQNEPSAQAIKELSQSLSIVKDVLEDIKSLNTRAKMPNLRLVKSDIEKLAEHLQKMEAIDSLLKFLKENEVPLSAVSRYETILAGRADGFFRALDELKPALNELYRNPSELPQKQEEVQRKIDEAKRQALIAYQNLYKRHRLDADGAKRKKRLVESPKMRALNKLSQIATLESGKIRGVHDLMDGLIPYTPVTDDQLLRSSNSLHPTDPFDPSKLESDLSAAELLEKCEQEIDRLYDSWQSNLLQELESDPSVQAGISALSAEERRGIDDFLRDRKLPDSIDDTFVAAVNQVLRGLKKKPVKRQSFVEAIFHDGKPLKPEELRQRVEEWIKMQTKNEEAGLVRFVLED